LFKWRQHPRSPHGWQCVGGTWVKVGTGYMWNNSKTLSQDRIPHWRTTRCWSYESVIRIYYLRRLRVVTWHL
jgi:hypothetical protein